MNESELINNHLDYSFFEDSSNYFLCVLCGGSALYEINIKLKEEINMFKKYGVEYIESFVSRIQVNPLIYVDRNTSF